MAPNWIEHRAGVSKFFAWKRMYRTLRKQVTLQILESQRIRGATAKFSCTRTMTAMLT
jgi:hypothetical protein